MNLNLTILLEIAYLIALNSRGSYVPRVNKKITPVNVSVKSLMIIVYDFLGALQE
jgi:hypothetical protein